MSEELQLLIEKLVYGGDGWDMPMEIPFLSPTCCQEKKFARRLVPARKS